MQVAGTLVVEKGREGKREREKENNVSVAFHGELFIGVAWYADAYKVRQVVSGGAERALGL